MEYSGISLGDCAHSVVSDDHWVIDLAEQTTKTNASEELYKYRSFEHCD